MLLLSSPTSEIESHFWKSMEGYSSADKIRLTMQETFVRRILETLQLSIYCAIKMEMDLPSVSEEFPEEDDLDAVRIWAEKLWSNENIRKAHEMIGDQYFACDT